MTEFESHSFNPEPAAKAEVVELLNRDWSAGVGNAGNIRHRRWLRVKRSPAVAGTVAFPPQTPLNGSLAFPFPPHSRKSFP